MKTSSIDTPCKECDLANICNTSECLRDCNTCNTCCCSCSADCSECELECEKTDKIKSEVQSTNLFENVDWALLYIPQKIALQFSQANKDGACKVSKMLKNFNQAPFVL